MRFHFLELSLLIFVLLLHPLNFLDLIIDLVLKLNILILKALYFLIAQIYLSIHILQILQIFLEHFDFLVLLV